MGGRGCRSWNHPECLEFTRADSSRNSCHPRATLPSPLKEPLSLHPHASSRLRQSLGTRLVGIRDDSFAILVLETLLLLEFLSCKRLLMTVLTKAPPMRSWQNGPPSSVSSNPTQFDNVYLERLSGVSPEAGTAPLPTAPILMSVTASWLFYP